MKERRSETDKIRTFDADGYTQRAGCLCFKTDQEREVLLVTSNRFPDQWIVPAGGVEHDESFKDAAIREVLEEAGVCGIVQRPLGVFQNDSNMSRTALFALLVKQEFDVWDDAIKGRKRGWFPIDKAFALLSHRPHQQFYLVRALNLWQVKGSLPFHQPCQLSPPVNPQLNNTSVAVCVDSSG